MLTVPALALHDSTVCNNPGRFPLRYFLCLDWNFVVRLISNSKKFSRRSLLHAGLLRTSCLTWLSLATHILSVPLNIFLNLSPTSFIAFLTAVKNPVPSRLTRLCTKSHFPVSEFQPSPVELAE